MTMHTPDTHGGPTDMMHRRKPLSLRGRFFWRGRSFTLLTDSAAVLSAAALAGFEMRQDSGFGAIWEIAAERCIASQDSEWECVAMEDTHSRYLTMGPYQWFALDLETGAGAGFVALPDEEQSEDLKVLRYFRAIVDGIATNQRADAEGSV